MPELDRESSRMHIRAGLGLSGSAQVVTRVVGHRSKGAPSFLVSAFAALAESQSTQSSRNRSVWHASGTAKSRSPRWLVARP
jgi:hypothetical protein